MSNRIKLTVAAPRTREEMETLVGDIAALKIKERQLTAEMDLKIKTVKDHYQGQLSGLNESLGQKMPRALAWAEAHPEDFGKLRSIEMLHGTLGWRTNTPSLKTLSGWTWDRVLEKVKSTGIMPGYLRIKEELNKQAILGDREIVGDDGLRAIGLKVVQDEEFFVEPKLTETEKREVVS